MRTTQPASIPPSSAWRAIARTLAGDRVTVEISTYDLDKGRVVFRHKDERAPAPGTPPRRTFQRRR